MSCTRHFLNFRWERHTWRQQVTASEVLTGHETDMWARGVYRNYTRCDKQQVCEVCGATRRVVSCLCDMTRAEHCPLLRAHLAASGHAVV